MSKHRKYSERYQQWRKAQLAHRLALAAQLPQWVCECFGVPWCVCECVYTHMYVCGVLFCLCRSHSMFGSPGPVCVRVCVSRVCARLTWRWKPSPPSPLYPSQCHHNANQLQKLHRYYIHELFMSRFWNCHMDKYEYIMSLNKESCHTYEWGMSHI